MKIHTLLYVCIAFVFILFSKISADTPAQTDTFTINLQFDRIEKPPKCFTSHKSIVRPKIGLALSGGGARGFAQVGVLKVFEEYNIPIDIIVGTSMGSIVGGLYAAGYSASEIEKIAQNVEWQHIMSDKPPRTNLFVGQKQERSKIILQIRFKGKKIDIPKAITPGQRLLSVLTNLTIGADFQSGSDFDNLRIPFRAVACDLLTGNKILLDHGNLATAMKASSAIPLLIEPVPLDGMLLADGGLVNNIPVDEVAKFKVDIIIAVDTVSDLNEASELNVPWKIADQVTTIMQQEKNKIQRQQADVLIQPKIEKRKSDNFKNVDELIRSGEQAARKVVPKILQLIKEKQNFFSNDTEFSFIKIEKIKLPEPIEALTDSVINTFKFQKLSDIYNCMTKIYQTGYFQDIKAQCLLENDTLHVNLKMQLNPTFQHITFLNNTVFSDSLLLAQIKSPIGVPINHLMAENDIFNLQKFYHSRGYTFMSVSEVKIKNDTLFITLNEGKISSINVMGNHRTKDFVIFREIPLKQGDFFNINKIKIGLDNIYSTNLFKTVSIDVDKDEKDQAIININIEEKAFTILRFSYRYNLERKNKTLFEVTEENFLGMGNPLSFQVQYGARDRLVSFKYRSDRILNTFLTNSVHVYLQENDYFVYHGSDKTGEYRQRDKGLAFSIGQQIERLGIFSVITSVRNVEIKPIYGKGFPVGNYDIKTIELQSIVDTQDKFPFPNYGKYYFFQYKISSAKFLNSQISYFKLFSSLDYFTTFLKRNTIHIKTLWGTSDLSTPFFEFFSLGGRSSFLGLYEKEIIGRHVIEGSLEYRYRFPFGFPFDVYLSVRYDFGGAWKKYVEDIRSEDFFHGFGGQLSTNTPVGPISFAVGKASNKKYVFYFNAGFEF